MPTRSLTLLLTAVLLLASCGEEESAPTSDQGSEFSVPSAGGLAELQEELEARGFLVRPQDRNGAEASLSVESGLYDVSLFPSDNAALNEAFAIDKQGNKLLPGRVEVQVRGAVVMFVADDRPLSKKELQTFEEIVALVEVTSPG